MFSKRGLAAAIWSFFLIGTACAATIRMDFRIRDSNGPIRETFGTLVYQADSPTSRIQSLTSIDFVVDGHRYTVDELGFISDWFEIYVMIGKMSPRDAINEVVSGTDDFFLIWDRETHEPREFVYSSSQRPGAWLTPFIDLTFSVIPEPPPPAAIPISPWTLMLIAGVIGIVGCRELTARRSGGKLMRQTGLKCGLRSS